MYNIACMYYFGDGVEKNDTLAFEWYKKAAQHQDPEAANRVGVMLENGIGCSADAEQAYRYYVQSADLGSLSGMANLSLCMLEGKGCEKDIPKGLLWMDKASVKGNGIASTLMGDYYQEGKYVVQDYLQAATYYERGMQQKYAPAIFKLAKMYEYGYGITKDLHKSKELEQLAKDTPDED
ncbi:hypothetical protein RGT18_10630 [Solobacterium moorei]|nr:hypothetical protein RGT18_10630 [Solobacterium moorei]